MQSLTYYTKALITVCHNFCKQIYDYCVACSGITIHGRLVNMPKWIMVQNICGTNCGILTTSQCTRSIVLQHAKGYWRMLCALYLALHTYSVHTYDSILVLIPITMTTTSALLLRVTAWLNPDVSVHHTL